jgi:hypothetical protein
MYENKLVYLETLLRQRSPKKQRLDVKFWKQKNHFNILYS